MRSGDIIRVDFGPGTEGEPSGERPAVVVMSDELLGLRAVVVVPCTTTRRGWEFEVDVEGFGVAQGHLVSTIGCGRIVAEEQANVGPVALAQLREILALVLGIES